MANVDILFTDIADNRYLVLLKVNLQVKGKVLMNVQLNECESCTEFTEQP